MTAPQLGGIAALVAKLAGGLSGVAALQPATYAVVAGAVVATTVVPNQALLSKVPDDTASVASTAPALDKPGQGLNVLRRTKATDSVADLSGFSSLTGALAPIGRGTSPSTSTSKTDDVSGSRTPRGVNIIQQSTTVEEGRAPMPGETVTTPSGEPRTESYRILRTETTTTVYSGIDRSSDPNLTDCAAEQYFGRDGNMTVISRTVYREVTRILDDGSKLVFTDSIREPDEYQARGLRENRPQECSDTEDTSTTGTTPPIESSPRGSRTPPDAEVSSGGYASGFGYVEPTSEPDTEPTVEPAIEPDAAPIAEPEAAPDAA